MSTGCVSTISYGNSKPLKSWAQDFCRISLIPVLPSATLAKAVEGAQLLGFLAHRILGHGLAHPPPPGSPLQGRFPSAVATGPTRPADAPADRARCRSAVTEFVKDQCR